MWVGLPIFRDVYRHTSPAGYGFERTVRRRRPSLARLCRRPSVRLCARPSLPPVRHWVHGNIVKCFSNCFLYPGSYIRLLIPFGLASVLFPGNFSIFLISNRFVVAQRGNMRPRYDRRRPLKMPSDTALWCTSDDTAVVETADSYECAKDSRNDDDDRAERILPELWPWVYLPVFINLFYLPEFTFTRTSRPIFDGQIEYTL